MITPPLTERLTVVLPHRYAPKVLEILKERNITNAKGDAFSAKYISHVFNGRYENMEIEAAILELYAREKKAQKKLSNIKKQIKTQSSNSGS